MINGIIEVRHMNFFKCAIVIQTAYAVIGTGVKRSVLRLIETVDLLNLTGGLRADLL